MGKFKSILEESIRKYPDLYNGIADEEFWMQCRKEEILERENKPPIKIIRKGKSWKKKKK
jgi:hypothetical protein